MGEGGQGAPPLWLLGGLLLLCFKRLGLDQWLSLPLSDAIPDSDILGGSQGP